MIAATFPGEVPVERAHSARNASIGLTRAARTAGSRESRRPCKSPKRVFEIPQDGFHNAIFSHVVTNRASRIKPRQRTRFNRSENPEGQRRVRTEQLPSRHSPALSASCLGKSQDEFNELYTALREEQAPSTPTKIVLSNP